MSDALREDDALNAHEADASAAQSGVAHASTESEPAPSAPSPATPSHARNCEDGAAASASAKAPTLTSGAASPAAATRALEASAGALSSSNKDEFAARTPGGDDSRELTALRVQDGNRQNHPKMLDKLYTCKWKNGTLQTARVVERRLDKNGNWEYYMHYEDFDRRLDEWVTQDRLGDEVIKHRSCGEVASAESNQKMTRTQKRRFDEIHTTMPVDVDPTTAALEHEREQATKVKNIQTVELGKYEMETWYYSPYPEEFSKCNKLFLCEFCLKYFRKSKTLERHKGKCECIGRIFT